MFRTSWRALACDRGDSELGRDWGPSVIFKGTPPVIYFFQLCLPPKVSRTPPPKTGLLAREEVFQDLSLGKQFTFNCYKVANFTAFYAEIHDLSFSS